jgi:sarcosine oxidase, subunit gamma
MADTLTRRSPLQGFASRFAKLPGSATVAEEPFVAMIDLWVDRSGPGGAAAAAVLGVDELPATPSTVTTGADTTVIWFGLRNGSSPPVKGPPRHWSRSCATR